eukprot:7380277-Prymnesium_polylepis.1
MEVTPPVLNFVKIPIGPIRPIRPSVRPFIRPSVRPRPSASVRRPRQSAWTDPSAPVRDRPPRPHPSRSVHPSVARPDLFAPHSHILVADPGSFN